MNMIHRSIQFSILLSLTCIFLAQLSFAPLLLNLGFAAILLLFGWRYRQLHPQPIGKIWQCLWICIGLTAIYLQYRTFIGIEAGVAVLTTILFAKALETKTSRDVIVLFNFALFVSASLFLYSQSIWMAVLILCCLFGCLLGLYRLQQAEFTTDSAPLRFKQDAKQVFSLSLYAIPFFILLFLFFPRLPPLWHVPIQNQQGVTGISDQMSPGDIAELSQSSALAFRIVAEMSRLPPRSQMYWRALVLDQYDGKRWTSSFLNEQTQPAVFNVDTSKVVDYQYLAANRQQIWITGLEQSIPVQPYFQLRQDGGITAVRRVQRTQPIRLRWIGHNKVLSESQRQLTDLQEKINTEIPQQKDLRAQRLAQQIFRQSQSDPQRYIQHILHWYQQHKFVYTLTPGRLGENRIDEFLFQSRQGFCEHYASSFVMLMRYVGIPARVVVGYQGGQLAPDAESWEVRQLDAHAWSEVWLNGQWQRIDPTAMVAPERIDQGMQDLLANNQQVFGNTTSGAWQYQQFNMLKTLRVWGDYTSYQWQRKVVGYDSETQKYWLSKLGLSSLYSSVLILVLGCVGVGILYFVLLKFGQWKEMPVFQREIHSFSKGLPAAWQKQHSETFQHWMSRLAQQCPEAQQTVFQQLVLLYQKVIFQQQQAGDDVKKFKNLLKECTFVLKQARKNLSEK